MSKDEEDDDGDALLWSHDLGRQSAGEFSMAVVQANTVIEDHSQLETSPAVTFVGVYDGHGGADASRYVSHHLFPNLTKFAREMGTISEEVISKAVSATEDGFLAHVRRAREINPMIAANGSCCLVGVIWRGTLYVANLGDSRAVLGSLGRQDTIVAQQLTTEHNASMEEVRQELISLHHDDPNIVVQKQGVWRIKGIIQVSRSIGDAYLKSPEFNIDHSVRFRLPEPLTRPVLTAEPSICKRILRPQDKFIIFASDGLWELLTNQEAVEVVHNFPRRGIARKLVRTALQAAARKVKIKYAEIKTVEKGIRRSLHDDITVVVVFIDDELLKGPNESVQDISVRGFIDAVGPSDISVLDVLNINSNTVV